jgi:hypothetical protein
MMYDSVSYILTEQTGNPPPIKKQPFFSLSPKKCVFLKIKSSQPDEAT